MNTYLKFISNAFQRSIAYKLEYYIGLVNAFLYIFIFTSVWKTVSRENPSALGPWTENTLIQYAVLSTLIKVSQGRNESLLTNKIKSGDIAYDLLKPYKLVYMYIADSLGVCLFQLLGRSLPLLAFSIFVFGVVPEVSIESFLKFIPAYIFSFGIFIGFGFMLSSLAFYFTEVFSFMILFSALLTLMSGSVIPINLFPEYFHVLVSWTPFPYLYYYTTALLIGSPIPFSYSELMLRYVLEFTIVSFCSFLIYRSGIKKLEIAGG
jgi:ABC-type uncharacterized transport system permease subunit